MQALWKGIRSTQTGALYGKGRVPHARNLPEVRRDRGSKEGEGGDAEMKSFSLSDLEVRYFMEHGQVLLVRPVKPQPGIHTEKVFRNNRQEWPCPYGQPGDKRPLKESWHRHYQGGVLGGRPCYHADNTCNPNSADDIGWLSPATMPLGIVRNFGVIETIAGQRLNELTEDEALSSGVGYIEITNIKSSTLLKQNFGYRYGNFYPNQFVWVIGVRKEGE
jgi:hypothetical protein